ncbi:MAG: thioredoxin [Nanoarchaeota archaeon]|nr:thioredoxin [Nanoarchaeota archaeon]
MELFKNAGLALAAASLSCAPAVVQQVQETPEPEPVYVQELAPENFNAVVLENELPVIVDFYTAGCRPCRELAPVFDEACREFYGKVKCASFNAYLDDYATAESYGIDGYPTLIPFCRGSGGEEIHVLKDLKFSLDEMRARLEELIENCVTQSIS